MKKLVALRVVQPELLGHALDATARAGPALVAAAAHQIAPAAIEERIEHGRHCHARHRPWIIDARIPQFPGVLNLCILHGGIRGSQLGLGGALLRLQFIVIDGHKCGARSKTVSLFTG